MINHFLQNSITRFEIYSISVSSIPGKIGKLNEVEANSSAIGLAPKLYFL